MGGKPRGDQGLRDVAPEWNPKALADVWKAERVRRGWSQKEVSERIGYRGHQQVSDLELGITSGQRYTDVALLASLFEINIADLTRAMGLPVARGEAAPDYAAMRDERLATAIRLLLASKDNEWRNLTIDRLYATVLAHEGAGADD